MSPALKTSACLIIIALTFGSTSVLHAQAFSRVACEVVDHEDRPLRGARITATTPAIPSFKTSAKTSKRGKCVLSFSKGTVPYQLEIELEGYQTLEIEVQPEVGKLIKRVFQLSPAGGADGSTAVLTADERKETRSGARNIILYNEGVEAQLTGDLEGALAKLRESVAVDQSFAPAFGGIAAVAMELGRLEQAAEAAEKAIELDPEDLMALRIRYDAYRKLGDESRSKAAADALKKAGNAEDIALRVFHEAVASFNQGQIDMAKVQLRQAIELDPELVEAYSNLAQIYNRDGNTEQAAEMAAQSLRRQPGDAAMLKIRYDALTRLGAADEAIQVLRELIAADPSWASTDLLAHAQALFSSSRLEQARVVLEQLVELQPEHPEAHYLLGLCLNGRGDTTEAAQHLQRFVELAPDHAEAPVAREILSYIS